MSRNLVTSIHPPTSVFLTYINVSPEMARTRHTMIREQVEKNPEFSETLLEKAAAAEHGDLNLNKTPEEMKEVMKKVDLALGRAEEELATHAEGEEEEEEEKEKITSG